MLVTFLFLWMVSHPGHVLIVMDGVPSWSWHQNHERERMDFQLLFVPQSGAMMILVTAPEIARGGGDFKSIRYISNLEPQEILVMAPEIARGGGNFW